MNEKQKEFKVLIPICPQCGKPMDERTCDWDLTSYKLKIKSEKDDLIQKDVMKYCCYNCNTRAFVLIKTKTQRLDDELLEMIDDGPSPKFYNIDTIYDLPETARDHEYFYIKKGYYDHARCVGGIWSYYRDCNDVKRCEDCIYFFDTKMKNVDECKLHPMLDGTPQGFCKHNFRLKDNCPMWDDWGKSV